MILLQKQEESSIFLRLSGCRGYDEKQTLPEQYEVTARYTAVPVVIDGVLDDPAWENAQVYKLSFSKDRDNELEEKGSAMVAWDSDYLYAGFKFYDSDIVALGEEDQIHHYRMGDVAEVFLNPAGQTYYRELYVTPAGNKAHFFIPGRGRLPLGIEDYSMDPPMSRTNFHLHEDYAVLRLEK